MNPDVAIVGYGVRVRGEAEAQVARYPTGRGPAPGSLVGALQRHGQLHNCLVAVRGDTAVLVPDASGKIVGFSLEPDGPAETSWKIETPGFTCAWPDHMKITILPHRLNRWEFELARGEGVVFLRGPLVGASETPAPHNLIAPGQRIVASDMSSDETWLELAYEHEGKPWRQKHRYSVPAPMTVVLVTAQAPEGDHEPLFAAVDEIAKSVRLREVPSRPVSAAEARLRKLEEDLRRRG